MNCSQCGAKFIKKRGGVVFDNKVLGKVTVPALEYKECKKCGEKLLDLKMSEKAAEFISKKEQEAINKLPVSEFISAKQAAKILGITKQAFSKHPCVKRGLILSVEIDGRKYYNLKSVELFKEKDNGKYLLADIESDRAIQYIILQPFGFQSYETGEEDYKAIPYKTKRMSLVR